MTQQSVGARFFDNDNDTPHDDTDSVRIGAPADHAEGARGDGHTMLGEEVLGRFRVTRHLPRGGMGDLWLADDGDQPDAVVLKTVRGALSHDLDVLRAFTREVDVTARLDHPYLVKHIAHGRFEDLDVLAVRHIPGVNLADMLEQSVLPFGAALRVAQDIARGLSYVHELAGEDGTSLGIVHGDASPENIVIGADGTARLVDFGNVTMRGMKTVTSTVVGKPGYLSPEQARGNALDGRSDQYTLGIVLWEMLAGRGLFPTDGLRNERAVPLLSSCTVVPYALEATVFRMLSPNAEDRFPTLDDAGDALAFIAKDTASIARVWLGANASRPHVELPARPPLREQATQPIRKTSMSREVSEDVTPTR